MAKVQVHPIQLEHAHEQGRQTYKFSGGQARWATREQPAVPGQAYDRRLRLVHPVKSHLAEVQGTFATGERKRQVTVTEDEPTE